MRSILLLYDYSCYAASSCYPLKRPVEDATPKCFLAISHGFQFDQFTGNPPSVGIPITLSWRFDTDDPDEVFFQQRNIGQQFFFQGDDIPTEITRPNGTLNVTFPSNGMFAIDAIASGTGHLDLVKSSEIFDLSLASEGSSSSATTSSSSSSASPSSGTSQKPSATAILPSESSSHGNRDRKPSIIIGAVIGAIVFLMLLLGGAILIRRRNYLRLKHSLMPNAKITFERQSISSLSLPPSPTEKEAMSPGFVPPLTNLVDVQPPRAEQDLEGLEEGAVERRESRCRASTPLRADISQPQMDTSAEQQEGPQDRTVDEGRPASTADTADMAEEILRLRNQVLPLIRRLPMREG